MMRTTRIRCLLGWVMGCILLIGWMSVAWADHSAVDAEENLARYGLSPEEILNERLGFDGETLKLLIPTRPDGTPTYTWFDITGDGCVDLCSGRMFGSGSHFFVPELQEVYPEEDFHLCIARDRFDFVLRIEKDGSGLKTVVEGKI